MREMESLMMVVGVLAVPYFIIELWWAPRQAEKLRREQSKRAMKAVLDIIKRDRP